MHQVTDRSQSREDLSAVPRVRIPICESHIQQTTGTDLVLLVTSSP